MNETLEMLDALLDEVTTQWAATGRLHIPSANASFRVINDGGLPVLRPQTDLAMGTVLAHLRVRTAGADNGILAPYVDGTLVPIGPNGAPVSVEPEPIALNDSLIVLVVPQPSEPEHVSRIVVAVA